jgi:RHS repeat-associated protein
MPDAVDNPTPRDALVVGEDGELYLETFGTDGHVISQEPVSAVDALIYLQNLIASSGSEVPEIQASNVAGDYSPSNVATLSHAELVAQARALLDKVADELRRANPAADAQTLGDLLVEQVSSAVIDPKAIRVVAEAIASINPAFVSRIWPSPGAVIAGPSGDPESEWSLPEFPASPSRVMEGTSTVGPGGVAPPNASVTLMSGGAAAGPSNVADPVLPFTGELHIESTDLAIDGIGLDVELRRTYRHGARYFGPLGERWDHSFNLWLREELERLPDGRYQHVVYRSSGALTVDRYTAEPTAAAVVIDDIADEEFTPPPGRFDRLEKQGGLFVHTTPDQVLVRYNDNLRASSIEDANGNTIRFVYDSSGEYLAALVDTCDREVRFDYDDSGHLIHVLDTSLDRHVWYGYDEDGRLNTVTKSVADGADPMLVMGYRYWGGTAPGDMAGNVTEILDGRGREVLQVRYGVDSGLIWYDRVVEQRDGGVTYFDYEFVTDDAEEDRLNVAFVRCRMTLPGGDEQVLDYNRMGRLVRLEIIDSDVPGSSFVTNWRFNEDGNAVREERPDGSVTSFVFEREVFTALRDLSEATLADRVRFGRLRRLVEYRRPGTAGPPIRVTEFDYDPIFGGIEETRGPYYADITGVRIDSGPAWTRRVTYDGQGKVQSTSEPDCTLPDGTAQPGREVSFSYDGRGRLTRRTVEASPGEVLATEFRYDDSGVSADAPTAEISDADGLAIEHTFVLDGGGRMIEARSPTGLRIAHHVDHLGRITREERWHPGVAEPAVESYEYGELAIPTLRRQNRVDPDGGVEFGAELLEEFSFDAEGDLQESRLRSADGTLDRLTTYQRDERRLLRSYGTDNTRIETTYNSRALPAETCLRAGGATTQTKRMRYDAVGRLASTIDEQGGETRREYDGFGRLALARCPSGSEEDFEWSARDLLVRHRRRGRHPDRVGRVLLSEMWSEYDEAGRLLHQHVMVFDPAGNAAGMPATTSFHYDRADRLVAMDDPAGRRRLITYDGLSRPVVVDDGAGTVTTTDYDDATGTTVERTLHSGVDSAGNPVSVSVSQRIEHDAQGRVIASEDQLGNRWQWTYDSRGSVRSEIDPAGVVTRYGTAPDGLVDSIVNAAGLPEEQTRTYRRDSERQLVAIDGPRGRILGVDRDAFGRPRIVNSGPERLDVTYDESGRIATIQDRAGAVSTMAYTSEGRLRELSVTEPAAALNSAREGSSLQLRFAYDGVNNLVRADDGAIPVDLRYDSRGLLLSEASLNTSVAWSYDLAGRPSTFTFPDGRQLEFERRADGHLERVLDTPAGAAGADELLQLWGAGANVVEQRWRGVLRRVEDLRLPERLVAVDEGVDGTPAAFSMRQVADGRGDPVARRLEVGPLAETLLADNDAHGRIVRAAFDDTALLDNGALAVAADQFDLDAAVATLAANIPATSERLDVTLDVDGARLRMERDQAGAPVEVRDYDPDVVGRCVEVGSGRIDDVEGLPLVERGNEYRYDALRRLASVERNGVTLVTVEYDALGRPVRLTTPAEVTTRIHARDDVVETAVGPVVTSQCARLPDGRPIEVGLPADPQRVFTDAQGSWVGLADINGDVIASAIWDPFGEVRATSAWSSSDPGFHGLFDLDATGLLLTPRRTYDPRCGAFREVDPLGVPEGSNRALFAVGNPLSYADPSGLMAQPLDQSGRSADAATPSPYSDWVCSPTQPGAVLESQDVAPGTTLPEVGQLGTLVTAAGRILSAFTLPDYVSKTSILWTGGDAKAGAFWLNQTRGFGVLEATRLGRLSRAISDPIIAVFGRQGRASTVLYHALWKPVSWVYGFMAGVRGHALMKLIQTDLAIPKWGFGTIFRFIEAPAYGFGRTVRALGQGLGQGLGRGLPVVGGIISAVGLAQDVETGDVASGVGNVLGLAAAGATVVGATAASWVLTAGALGYTAGSYLNEYVVEPLIDKAAPGSGALGDWYYQTFLK